MKNIKFICSILLSFTLLFCCVHAEEKDSINIDTALGGIAAEQRDEALINALIDYVRETDKNNKLSDSEISEKLINNTNYYSEVMSEIKENHGTITEALSKNNINVDTSKRDGISYPETIPEHLVEDAKNMDYTSDDRDKNSDKIEENIENSKNVSDDTKDNTTAYNDTEALKEQLNEINKVLKDNGIDKTIKMEELEGNALGVLLIDNPKLAALVYSNVSSTENGLNLFDTILSNPDTAWGKIFANTVAKNDSETYVNEKGEVVTIETESILETMFAQAELANGLLSAYRVQLSELKKYSITGDYEVGSIDPVTGMTIVTILDTGKTIYVDPSDVKIDFEQGTPAKQWEELITTFEYLWEHGVISDDLRSKIPTDPKNLDMGSFYDLLRELMGIDPSLVVIPHEILVSVEQQGTEDSTELIQKITAKKETYYYLSNIYFKVFKVDSKGKRVPFDTIAERTPSISFDNETWAEMVEYYSNKRGSTIQAVSLTNKNKRATITMAQMVQIYQDWYDALELASNNENINLKTSGEYYLPQVEMKYGRGSKPEFIEGSMDFETWLYDNYTSKLGLSSQSERKAAMLFFILNYWSDLRIAGEKYNTNAFLTTTTYNEYYYPNRQDVELNYAVFPAIFKYNGQKTTLKYGYEIEITATVKKIIDNSSAPNDAYNNAMGEYYMYMPLRELPILVEGTERKVSGHNEYIARVDGKSDSELTCAIPWSVINRMEDETESGYTTYKFNLSRSEYERLKEKYKNAFYEKEELEKLIISSEDKIAEKTLLSSVENRDTKLSDTLNFKYKINETIAHSFSYTRNFKQAVAAAQQALYNPNSKQFNGDIFVSCANTIEAGDKQFTLYNNTSVLKNYPTTKTGSTILDKTIENIRNQTVGSTHLHEVSILCSTDFVTFSNAFVETSKDSLFPAKSVTTGAMLKALGHALDNEYTITNKYYVQNLNGNIDCEYFKVDKNVDCPATSFKDSSTGSASIHSRQTSGKIDINHYSVSDDCSHCSGGKVTETDKETGNIITNDCTHCGADGRINEHTVYDVVGTLNCGICGSNKEVYRKTGTTNPEGAKHEAEVAMLKKSNHKKFDLITMANGYDKHTSNCYVLSSYDYEANTSGVTRLKTTFEGTFWQSVSFETYLQYKAIVAKYCTKAQAQGAQIKTAAELATVLPVEGTEYKYRYKGYITRTEKRRDVVLFIPDSVPDINPDSTGIKVENFISK